MREGFRIGRRAQWLMEQDWERLLPELIEQVREQLEIGTPEVYQRALPHHDPSRSKSAAARASAEARAA